MKLSTGLCALTLCSGAIANAQQPDPVTDVTITGHVFEPQAVAPTDERIAQLSLPDGFHIHRFAEGLENPRMLAVASDGTVYVTQRAPGNLVMLRDTDGDGIVDAQKIVLKIPGLHGIAIRGNEMFLVDVHTVYSAILQTDGSVTGLKPVSRNLPDAGQHPNRTVGFGPDGALYVTVGSTCNACEEPNPENATLLRVNLDTGRREIFASGLRNTIGFGWHPGSNRLYGLDHGIDWLGDTEHREELNEIVENAQYGWPFVYDDSKFNPQDEPREVTQQEWAEKSTEPVNGYEPHAAPMQLAFYSASQFPTDYRGNAFVAMHGSWNRKPASGYEVVRVKFSDAGEFQSFEPFVTGFLVPQPKTAPPPLPNAQPFPEVGFIARPTGIAVAKGGSLLIGDDTNNVIYRVLYGNPTATPSPQKLAGEILEAKSDRALTVQSSAFAANGLIPEKYSAYGAGISPPLSWSTPPAGTRSIVLMMEDPGATSPLPFVHWIAFGPDSITQIPENIPPLERSPKAPGAQQGSNSRSAIGYFGPRPPVGDPAHAYHFQIFALDTPLRLPSGFNRHALLQAMQGHVLAKGELVGKFARAP
jgi:Raf kinase inhibitor-like YbhB/YbcL family protein